MKIDFRNINANNLKVGSIFFLYGNYKKTFEMFCDFVSTEFQKKEIGINIHFCSIAECLGIINGQRGLFESGVDCFCIKNIEDNHLDKVSKLFQEKNCIFILESGNYMKSKKITDYLLKSEALAISSFDNDLTRHSIVRMFFSDASQSTRDEIAKIINNTDEDLYSAFRKISLLLNDGDALKDYYTYKQSFLSGLDLIPLMRFLLQTVMRERIVKSQNFSKISIKNPDAINHLLHAELLQKFGVEISRGYVYQKLIK
ncbi:MAG: hypothetical protein LBJ71_00395 [Holosporaceae bacterium]|jgi:hypothetical protein|nr:hypothetical protein [Holosporaceae bacterium]